MRRNAIWWALCMMLGLGQAIAPTVEAAINGQAPAAPDGRAVSESMAYSRSLAAILGSMDSLTKEVSAVKESIQSLVMYLTILDVLLALMALAVIFRSNASKGTSADDGKYVDKGDRNGINDHHTNGALRSLMDGIDRLLKSMEQDETNRRDLYSKLKELPESIRQALPSGKSQEQRDIDSKEKNGYKTDSGVSGEPPGSDDNELDKVIAGMMNASNPREYFNSMQRPRLVMKALVATAGTAKEVSDQLLGNMLLVCQYADTTHGNVVARPGVTTDAVPSWFGNPSQCGKVTKTVKAAAASFENGRWQCKDEGTIS